MTERSTPLGPPPEVVELDRSRTGLRRWSATTEGLTFEARILPRHDGRTHQLEIRGPIENKRPLVAVYDLDASEALQWPDFTGRTEGARTRRRRFNAAAWALIDAANTPPPPEPDLVDPSSRFVPIPRPPRTCAVCAGPVHRRTSIVAPHGMEDPTLPLLHLHPEDWQDNPHDAVLAE